MLEGESIFISPWADGSRIDIKGDSAKGKEWGCEEEEEEEGRLGKSDSGVESRAERDWEITGRRQTLRMERLKRFRGSEVWSHEGE